MIHFDFLVEDWEAEEIMDCIQSAICRCRQNIIKEMAGENSEPVKIAYENHEADLINIKEKMHNKRVQEQE